jgi:NADH-quinone oxidoreductase subunit J
MGPKGGQVRMAPLGWIGPAVLTAILMVELFYVAGASTRQHAHVVQVAPDAVAAALLGPYLLGVELASMLLLSALVGAYHLAYHLGMKPREEGEAT